MEIVVQGGRSTSRIVTEGGREGIWGGTNLEEVSKDEFVERNDLLDVKSEARCNLVGPNQNSQLSKYLSRKTRPATGEQWLRFTVLPGFEHDVPKCSMKGDS